MYLGSSQNQVKASQACTIVAADQCVCGGGGGGEDSGDSPGWVDRNVFNYQETINKFTYTLILEILPQPP